MALNSSNPAQGIALMFAGAALMALAALSAIFHNSFGLGAKMVWFDFAAGGGLLGAGYFMRENARQYGAVILSLFLGGAAQLWMTQPLWFPAFRIKPDNMSDLAMLALIALQALTAVLVLHKTGALGRAGSMVRTFGALRLLIFLGFCALFSVSIMGYLPRGFIKSYILHMVAGGALVGVNLLSVAALLSLPAPFTKWRGFNPLIPAATVFAAAALLSWFAFERMPHVEDEVVYLFQAETIAGGSYTVPAPPEAAQPGLDYYLLDVRDGAWFATTPPGWPTVLAAGVLAGSPWLVNPLLAALAVLFGYGVAKRLGGQKQADTVMLLMATSPWFIGAAASLMPHVLAITLTLAAWWLLLVQASSLRRAVALAFMAGLAMGWLFATRQLEGLLLGTLTGAWLLLVRRNDPHAMARTGIYALGAIFTGSFYLIHNKLLTGSLLLPPLGRYLSETWHKGANAYGFGPDIGPPGGWGDLDIAPGHSPYEGLINTLHNISGLQLEMLGWGIGSLALVVALLLWGRPTRRDAAMAIVALSIITALFFYWFSGSFYIGPRYWFSAFFPLLFLSASGFMAFMARLEKMQIAGASAGITLFMLGMFALFVFVPWRGVTKFYHYGTYTATLRDKARSGAFGNAVVFVKMKSDPGSALVLNDPWLPDDKPLFLISQGEEQDARAAAAFPGRPVLYYTEPGAS